MLSEVIEAVISAGEKILDIYETGDFGVEMKSDDSPLTKADQAAHEILVAALQELNAGPVLSEEDANIAWTERKHWQQYWLVDPLDGTKEFIKKNGEFTVNVALIRDGEPVLGVVYAPVLKVLYTGEKDKGAYKRVGASDFKAISPSQTPNGSDTWRVVGSRSHSSKEFDEFMANFANSDLVSVGSSLKLCMVAEGAADLYPRLIPTCEWDTAAAQAVVEAAGAMVVDWDSRQPLRYNTKDSLLNPFFLVCASADALDQLSQ